MPDEREIRARLKNLIVERLRPPGVTAEAIADEDPLFGAGLGLDSVDALELAVGLEKEFGIKIQSPEVEREAFESVTSLARMVERHLGHLQERTASHES